MDDLGPGSGWLFRVIDPAEAAIGRSNYLLPQPSRGPGDGVSGLQDGDEVAIPRPVPGALGSGTSAGPDGRIARAGTPAYDPPEQLPWGFGYARSQAADGPALALTDLPADPAGFTVRQQDAVRRDVAETLDDYVAYAPVPFAASNPLSGEYPREFRGFAAEPAPEGVTRTAGTRRYGA